MANLAGILTVKTAATTDLVGEWQETVLARNAAGFNTGSTLFGLMARLAAEEAENTVFNWFERDPIRNDYYINNGAGYTSTDTTIAIDDNAAGSVYQLLADGDILRVTRTGEYIRVSGDPSSAAVVVVRGALGSVAAALVDNDLMDLVTRAKDEGANPSRAAYQEPDALFNYIQTYNRTVDLTNLFKGNKLRTDSEGPLMERRIQALEAIARDIEKSFLIGKRDVSAGSTGNVYTTGGIYDALNIGGYTSNILNGLTTAGVSLSVFLDWLQSFMIYGNSETKLAFCGPKAYAVVSKFAISGANGFRIMGEENTFGISITAILTPFGVLNLCMHPLLAQSSSYTDWMFVVDLSHVVQKVQETLFLETNIQLPGQDSYKEQFRAKLGLKLKFARAFGVAYGLQKLL